jgi:lipopolysaccharide biosynthesis protein
MSNKIKPIAIYLPQFHPIPENDQWWGKGFTEWINVVKAKPRFEGHYQPHLPADLGFYDLRLEEIRIAQAELAKEYGIYGFCYYHYWFNGKRILERPFQEVFESKKPDFPFMLCWANENWTRVWDGGENGVLLKQEYSEEDDLVHIQHLIPYFKDARYIKVGDKPVFIFYKPDLFPDMKKTLEIFRTEARKEGLELYLCRFERWNGSAGEGVNEVGFDAAIEFQPLSVSLKKYFDLKKKKSISHSRPTYLNQMISKITSRINHNSSNVNSKDDIVNYKDFIDFDLIQTKTSYKCFPCVCPMWDNSSRRTKESAIIFDKSTPNYFKHWYASKCKNFEPYSDDENFIFINAWNEWAEGNHLEPDQKWGRKYLEALKDD